MNPGCKKRALVTGASGSLGRDISPRLWRAPECKLLAARRAEALKATVEEIQASGGEAVAVEMDVTDSTSTTLADY
ncbi:SDR family NAD(P)-dependent oxidoreductase [Methyloceanibacter sp.]|uniref:SDR family NAD(P)-dependent oxidoreductase n=1 Tax=Methyloceanibacter sp. TaxID=1965321 RepID=UPI003D6D884B